MYIKVLILNPFGEFHGNLIHIINPSLSVCYIHAKEKSVLSNDPMNLKNFLWSTYFETVPNFHT